MNVVILHPESIQHGLKSIEHGTAVITDPEKVSHLRQVLKVTAGDSIKIAVLNGNLGTARVSHVTDDKVTLNRITANQAPPKKLPLTLVLALPRPKALRRLVMDAVAMGVADIYLINSYRVEKSYWQSPHLQKLTDYMQLGLAQAGDSVLPNIQLKKRFKPFVEDELANVIGKKTAFVAHPQAVDNIQAYLPRLVNNNTNNENGVVLVIGAEGGFIPYEIDLLTQHGCQPVSIYERVLRTETAVSMLVGLLLAYL